MREIKRWILKDETHVESNCVAITVICHGDELGYLLDKNKKRSWKIEDFVGDLSLVETLLGKPKILVVQACRGSKYQVYYNTYHKAKGHWSKARFIAQVPVTIDNQLPG